MAPMRITIIGFILALLTTVSFASARQSTDLLYTCNNDGQAPYLFFFAEFSEGWEQHTFRLGDIACDVDAYWRAELGSAYTPPHYITHAIRNPDGSYTMPDGVPACTSPFGGVWSGFYCWDEPQQGIVLNRDLMLEFEQSGDRVMGVVDTIAHEWGHHIQWLLGDEIAELEAECYLGAFMSGAIAAGNTRFGAYERLWNWYLPGYLDPALADVLSYEEGAAPPRWEGISHYDTGLAMQLGSENGAAACRQATFTPGAVPN